MLCVSSDFLRGGRISTLGLGRTLTLRYSLVSHNCKGSFFGGQIDPSILVGVLGVFPYQNPNIVTMYKIQLKKATILISETSEFTEKVTRETFLFFSPNSKYAFRISNTCNFPIRRSTLNILMVTSAYYGVFGF